MPLSLRLSTALIVAPVLVTSVVFSYGTGVWPGKDGINGKVPNDVARQVPSCGGCHRQFPGGLGLSVSCVPTARLLAPNQSISITTSATGGITTSMWGGFITEASRGAFAAGSNSQLATTSSAFVTHVFAFNSNNRSWTYGYTAPSAPGLVELFSVVNTVDGDGRPDADFWAFHGFVSGATVCTPVRLYVLAQGISAIGTSCVGSFNQYPVLGSKTAPAVGNAGFAIELHGAAPSSQCALLVGANPSWQPLDLTVIGITGCSLYVDPLLSTTMPTSAGDLYRAEGTATFALPIPNDAALHGGVLQAQCAIIDGFVSSRPLKVTMTNGLSIAIP